MLGVKEGLSWSWFVELFLFEHEHFQPQVQSQGTFSAPIEGSEGELFLGDGGRKIIVESMNCGYELSYTWSQL